jgi:NCS1 family nucleobase:cation symporter-1
VLWTDGPGMKTTAQYTWFIGMALGFAVFAVISPRRKAGL